MKRMLLLIGTVGSLHASAFSAPPAPAGADDTEEEQTAEAPIEDAYDDLVQEAQWKSGRSPWRCVIRDGRGRTFSAQHSDRRQARRLAFGRCGEVSQSCFFSSCR